MKKGEKVDHLKRLIVNEDGQGVLEYTLMVGLVVMVIWAAIFTFGIPAALNTLWSSITDALDDLLPTCCD